MKHDTDWNVWVAIGELAARDTVIARAKAIALFDYRSTKPSRNSLWWQMSDISHVLFGIKADHDYVEITGDNDYVESQS